MRMRRPAINTALYLKNHVYWLSASPRLMAMCNSFGKDMLGGKSTALKSYCQLRTLEEPLQ